MLMTFIRCAVALADITEAAGSIVVVITLKQYEKRGVDIAKRSLAQSLSSNVGVLK